MTTVVAAATAAVPVIGGTAALLWEQSVRPVVNRRQVEWLNDLADAVAGLQATAEAWNFDVLGENEEFGAAVATALDAAARTAQADKLDMLKNAVLNCVGPEAPPAFEQATFLRYVDELEPLHVQLLEYALDPEGWHAERNLEMAGGGFSGSPRLHFENAFPDLPREVWEVIFHDLEQRRLSSIPQGGMMTLEGSKQALATEFGRRFYRFVTDRPG